MVRRCEPKTSGIGSPRGRTTTPRMISRMLVLLLGSVCTVFQAVMTTHFSCCSCSGHRELSRTSVAAAVAAAAAAVLLLPPPHHYDYDYY